MKCISVLKRERANCLVSSSSSRRGVVWRSVFLVSWPRLDVGEEWPSNDEICMYACMYICALHSSGFGKAIRMHRARLLCDVMTVTM